MLKKIGIIAALSTMALLVAAPSASAAIVSTINPANAPHRSALPARKRVLCSQRRHGDV